MVCYQFVKLGRRSIDRSYACRFVWRKKIERDVTQGVPLEMFSVKEEKRKQRERMVWELQGHFLCFFFVAMSRIHRFFTF